MTAYPYKDESGHGHYKKMKSKEEYWDGNCKVERKWEGNGEYKEERKCRGGDYYYDRRCAVNRIPSRNRP